MHDRLECSIQYSGPPDSPPSSTVEIGVLGNALAWFESYLRPKFCKVKVGIRFSTISSLDCSIPQGSLAGPNLYSAYASTLQEVFPNDVGLSGFADDHSVKKIF